MVFAATAGARSPPPTSDAAVDAQLERWLADSDAIFEGTVTHPGSSMVCTPPESEALAILSVQALYSPQKEPLVGLPQVALLGHPESFQGEHAIFAARSATFDKGLALHYVGQLPRIPADLARRVAAARTRIAEHRLAARLASAPLIVLGTVDAVRGSPPSSVTREHVAGWNAASIKIDSVLKGDMPAQLDVLFPIMRDGPWHARRRFTAGERGIWILQPAPGALGASYTALDALDFQPPERVDALRALIAPH